MTLLKKKRKKQKELDEKTRKKVYKLIEKQIAEEAKFLALMARI